MIYTTIKIMSSPLSTKKYTGVVYFITNRFLATIGSTQPYLCTILLNVTDITIGLHMLHAFFNAFKGK